MRLLIHHKMLTPGSQSRRKSSADTPPRKRTLCCIFCIRHAATALKQTSTRDCSTCVCVLTKVTLSLFSSFSSAPASTTEPNFGRSPLQASGSHLPSSTSVLCLKKASRFCACEKSKQATPVIESQHQVTPR